MNQTEVEELVPSSLGTKEYWNKAYETEVRNYESHGDVGEVWFGEDSALRIIRWISTSNQVKQDDEILDLGCGNGMLLIELAREGFTNLTGVDYCENAIMLAKAVAKSQDLPIRYQVADILSSEKAATEYAVALDKGTYDAISLHPDDSKGKREMYINNVWDSLSINGLLILTSCNWTKDELLVHFQPRFALHHVIPTPTFQFGGKIGNLITSIILKKV